MFYESVDTGIISLLLLREYSFDRRTVMRILIYNGRKKENQMYYWNKCHNNHHYHYHYYYHCCRHSLKYREETIKMIQKKWRGIKTSRHIENEYENERDEHDLPNRSQLDFSHPTLQVFLSPFLFKTAYRHIRTIITLSQWLL